MKAEKLHYGEKFISKSQVKNGVAMLFERVYPEEKELKDAEKEGKGILGKPCSKNGHPILVPPDTEIIKII